MKAIRSVAELAPNYDLLVIGAGPAGLSAAIDADALGLSTLLVDENTAPGGQIYRGITTTPVVNRSIFGADYWRGEALTTNFAASGASYAAGAAIWTVGAVPGDLECPAGFEAGLSLDKRAQLFRVGQVIAATGALERPFPIPGWTLPGVMTAGAAQIALKTSGLVPAGRVVVAGCGPLLYLLTAQLRAAGASVVAMLDTTPRGNWAKAAPHVVNFLRSPYFGKGLKLLAGALRGMKTVRGVTAMQAAGENRLEGVSFTAGGREQRFDCDLLLLHQGVVPNVNLSNAVGCRLAWDDSQLCWVPEVDAWFGTSLPGFAVAGDGSGIAGAEAAALRGRLAALRAAESAAPCTVWCSNSHRPPSVARPAKPIRAGETSPNRMA